MSIVMLVLIKCKDVNKRRICETHMTCLIYSSPEVAGRERSRFSSISPAYNAGSFKKSVIFGTFFNDFRSPKQTKPKNCFPCKAVLPSKKKKV